MTPPPLDRASFYLDRVQNTSNTSLSDSNASKNKTNVSRCPAEREPSSSRPRDVTREPPFAMFAMSASAAMSGRCLKVRGDEATR